MIHFIILKILLQISSTDQMLFYVVLGDVHEGHVSKVHDAFCWDAGDQHELLHYLEYKYICTLWIINLVPEVLNIKHQNLCTYLYSLVHMFLDSDTISIFASIHHHNGFEMKQSRQFKCSALIQ